MEIIALIKAALKAIPLIIDELRELRIRMETKPIVESDKRVEEVINELKQIREKQEILTKENAYLKMQILSGRK